MATADGHSGEGHAWGAGLGFMDVVGTLFYSDWDTLKSKDNDFYIVAAAEEEGAISITFLVDGTAQATAIVVGDGVAAAIGVDGTFSWSG